MGTSLVDGLEGLMITGYECPDFAARLGIRVNLEATVDADLVHVDGVVAALAMARRLDEQLVGELLLRRHGHARAGAQLRYERHHDPEPMPHFK